MGAKWFVWAAGSWRGLFVKFPILLTFSIGQHLHTDVMENVLWGVFCMCVWWVPIFRMVIQLSLVKFSTDGAPKWINNDILREKSGSEI